MRFSASARMIAYNGVRLTRLRWDVHTPPVLGITRMRRARPGRYRAGMAMTHALITTAQAPIARGPLQAIRLRVRRLALECAG